MCVCVCVCVNTWKWNDSVTISSLSSSTSMRIGQTTSKTADIHTESHAYRFPATYFGLQRLKHQKINRLPQTGKVLWYYHGFYSNIPLHIKKNSLENYIYGTIYCSHYRSKKAYFWIINWKPIWRPVNTNDKYNDYNNYISIHTNQRWCSVYYNCALQICCLLLSMRKLGGIWLTVNFYCSSTRKNPSVILTILFLCAVIAIIVMLTSVFP